MVLGRLRVADQRRRTPRRGSCGWRCSSRWPRSCRRAGGAGRVRRGRADLRRSPTRSCGSPTSCCSCWPAARTRSCATRSLGLAVSTAIGAGLLIAAAFAERRRCSSAIWGLALVLDVGGPLVIEPSGWRLVPGHFAERHGAIVIIALGESIVAIGVGAHERVDAGIVARGRARPGGGGVPVVGLLRRHGDRRPRDPRARRAGRAQNRIARDSYSYLHFPMVAGIALLAVGVKQTLADVSAHLGVVIAFALTRRGGAVPARAVSPSACGCMRHLQRPPARRGARAARAAAAALAAEPRWRCSAPSAPARGDDRLRGAALRGGARPRPPERARPTPDQGAGAPPSSGSPAASWGSPSAAAGRCVTREGPAPA